ncbi:MAG: thioredoxin-dependent thiol peroxidase [Bacteroidetes bacterium]|nr:thioredoxin-dependent thiol peroxidase [Bacteroidota bacterium]
MKLNIGDKAPDIIGKDQNGNTISLKDFINHKVILYFYPKDSTPGCTAEACSLRDNYDALMKKGFKVIGVSCDNEVSHKKFIEKYNLPFPLIADTDKKVVNDFGVWGEKKFMGKTYFGVLRTTFVISEAGIIDEIIEKVETKNHAQQILDIIKK